MYLWYILYNFIIYSLKGTLYRRKAAGQLYKIVDSCLEEEKCCWRLNQPL